MLHVERHGIVPNVVFPAGIDRHDDLGSPDRFDVYYGMADTSTPVEQPTGPTQSHRCTATRVVCCVVCGIVCGIVVGVRPHCRGILMLLNVSDDYDNRTRYPAANS